MTNPYAPPTADLSKENDLVWTKKQLLIIDRNCESLPKRCFVCNQKADKMVLYKLSYTPPWVLFFFIFFCFFLAVISVPNTIINNGGFYLLFWPVVIILMLIKRRAKIRLGLCQKHNKERIFSFYGGLLIIILSVVIGSILSQYNPLLSISSIVFFFIVFLVFAFFYQKYQLKAKKITKQMIWLKGTNKSYLAVFPTLP